jgi:hypothetical protein
MFRKKISKAYGNFYEFSLSRVKTKQVVKIQTTKKFSSKSNIKKHSPLDLNPNSTKYSIETSPESKVQRKTSA